MLDVDNAERILAPDPVSAAKAAGRTAVMKPEVGESKILALREAAEMEAQKIVDGHKDKLARLQESAERQEHVRQRRAQQVKEQNEKLLERIQKRVEKEAKTNELIKKSHMEQRANSNALMHKLKDGFRKAEDHKRQTLGNWCRVKQERIQQIGDVLDKKAELQQTAQQEMVRAYQEREDQINSRMAKMQENHGNRTQAARDQFSERQAALHEMYETKQAEKEELYKKTAERQKQAQDAVATKYEERSQAVRDELEKRFTKKDTVMQSLRKTKIEKRKVIMEKAQKQAVGPDSPKGKVVGEWLQKRLERKFVMDEVVLQNQHRLGQAHEFAREQMLCKIQENNARADGLVEQRASLQQQRAQLIKESMLEKARLEEQLRHVKFVPAASKATEDKTDEKK